MRGSTSLLLLSFLALSAGASNNAGVFERSGCDANKCLLAVVMEAVLPTPAAGVIDCQSFQTTTVTPCPVTTTSTMTTTVISAIATVSGGTTTVAVPSTSVVSGTITATVTIASANTTNYMWKRQAPSQPLIDGGLDLVKRAASSASNCVPEIPEHTAIPTYATDCPNMKKYASACACLGITARIKIADAPVVTVMATATATVNGTSTALQTVSSTSIVYVADGTVTTTVDTGPAQTVSPYGGMTQFYLKVDNSDDYLFADNSSPGQRLVLKEGEGMIEATDSDGFLQLAYTGHPFFANVALTGHDYINTVNTTDQSLAPPVNNRVKCLCGGALGSSGELSCTARNGQNYLQTCGEILYISQGPVSGCNPISLSCYPLAGAGASAAPAMM